MQSISTKVILANGARAGKLRGNSFEIEISGQVGSVIYFDVEALQSAADAGAVSVTAVNYVRRKRYTARIDAVLSGGLALGGQVCYPLAGFTVSDAGKLSSFAVMAGR